MQHVARSEECKAVSHSAQYNKHLTALKLLIVYQKLEACFLTLALEDQVRLCCTSDGSSLNELQNI